MPLLPAGYGLHADRGDDPWGCAVPHEDVPCPGRTTARGGTAGYGDIFRVRVVVT